MQGVMPPRLPKTPHLTVFGAPPSMNETKYCKLFAQPYFMIFRQMRCEAWFVLYGLPLYHLSVATGPLGALLKGPFVIPETPIFQQAKLTPLRF